MMGEPPAWRTWLVGVMSTSRDLDTRYRASEALAELDAARARVAELEAKNEEWRRTAEELYRYEEKHLALINRQAARVAELEAENERLRKQGRLRRWVEGDARPQDNANAGLDPLCGG